MSLLVDLKQEGKERPSKRGEDQEKYHREQCMYPYCDSRRFNTTVTPSTLETLKRLEKIIDCSPDDVETNLKLMDVYESLGNVDAARGVLVKLDTLSSGDRSLQTRVARQFMKMGDNEKAIERWCEIEKLYKDHCEATNALAHLYFRTNRYTKVLEVADRLETAHQLDERANRLRARCYMEQERWAEAISTLNLILSSNSDDLDAHIQIVTCYLKTDDLESASRKIASLDEWYPDSRQLNGLKHRLYLREEKWDKALEINTLLLSRDSRNRRLLNERAMIMYRLKRYDDAERYCLEVLDSRPDDVRALTIYARIGQARAARIDA